MKGRGHVAGRGGVGAAGGAERRAGVATGERVGGVDETVAGKAEESGVGSAVEHGRGGGAVVAAAAAVSGEVWRRRETGVRVHGWLKRLQVAERERERGSQGGKKGSR